MKMQTIEYGRHPIKRTLLPDTVDAVRFWLTERQSITVEAHLNQNTGKYELQLTAEDGFIIFAPVAANSMVAQVVDR